MRHISILTLSPFLLAASVLLPSTYSAMQTQNRLRDHVSQDPGAKSTQLRGKVVLLFFGYTHCPDACPTTMAKLSRVYKLLGADAKQVVTLFVSVDLDRDTTSVLKSYLAYFHLNSIGLSGSKEEIDAVVKQYGAKYEIEQSDSAAGYHINHSDDLYLLNQKGALANLCTNRSSPGRQERAASGQVI